MEVSFILPVVLILIIFRAWASVNSDEEDECDSLESMWNPWCPDYWLYNDD